jgi:chaperone LolA
MKNIKIIPILFSVLIVVLQFSLLYSAEKESEEIIKKLKDRYNKLESFVADYNQTFHWKLADNVHQQSGKIWLKGKDKFKIETEDQLIISDGKTIWTYSRFNNQVIIDNVNKSEEVSLPGDLFLKYSEQYNSDYVRNEKIDDEDCYLINLKAKTEDIFIKSMRIWISRKKSIPMKIEQIDINGNVNTYLLKNINIDEKLNDNFFVFKVIDTVEVIDMR